MDINEQQLQKRIPEKSLTSSMDNTVYANFIFLLQKLSMTLKGQFPLMSVRFEIILPKELMTNGVQGYKLDNLKEKTTA